MLTMKLLKERCLECSICAMFFSSSLTVSMTALLHSRILSSARMSMFLILLRTRVTSCIPLMKSISKMALPIYPRSPQSLPLMSCT